MEWYLKALKNYVGFEGRARRKEYWTFQLVSLVIAVVLTGIDAALNTAGLAGLYVLAVLLPGIAVAVRRLHDTDRSGWWLLISFVPLVGNVVLLVFLFTDSTPGSNQYGPSPKHAVASSPPAIA